MRNLFLLAFLSLFLFSCGDSSSSSSDDGKIGVRAHLEIFSVLPEEAASWSYEAYLGGHGSMLIASHVIELIGRIGGNPKRLTAYAGRGTYEAYIEIVVPHFTPSSYTATITVASEDYSKAYERMQEVLADWLKNRPTESFEGNIDI